MTVLKPELYEAWIEPEDSGHWERWRVSQGGKVSLMGRADKLFQDSEYAWKLFQVHEPAEYPNTVFGMPLIARAGQRTRPPDKQDDVPAIDTEGIELAPKLELDAKTIGLGLVGVVGLLWLLKGR